MKQLRVVGKPLPRLDGVDSVTGRAIYTVDVALPGLLHARLLRSSLPHRETVKNFMRAFVAGLARFRSDREFGARVLGKNLRENDPKILQETYDFWLKVFPGVPKPGPEDATVFLELMQVKEQRDWREFVDTSVMDELDREGFLSSVYK